MAGPSLAPVECRVDSRDRHRMVTWLTLAGLLAGAVVAIAGVPRIDLHGPLHHLGVMDPLCGGTRAAFLLSRGHWDAAWTYNPIVFPLAALAASALVRAAAGWATGRWVTIQVTRPWPLIVVVVVIVAVLEVRQQLHADLLTTDWAGWRPG
jgi:hypothetical protein